MVLDRMGVTVSVSCRLASHLFIHHATPQFHHRIPIYLPEG